MAPKKINPSHISTNALIDFLKQNPDVIDKINMSFRKDKINKLIERIYTKKEISKDGLS